MVCCEVAGSGDAGRIGLWGLGWAAGEPFPGRVDEVRVIAQDDAQQLSTDGGIVLAEQLSGDWSACLRVHEMSRYDEF
jgi:hypothetical protein